MKGLERTLSRATNNHGHTKSQLIDAATRLRDHMEVLVRRLKLNYSVNSLGECQTMATNVDRLGAIMNERLEFVLELQELKKDTEL